MTDVLLCYRCGESLASLSLPLSRRDLCPSCGTELHVCRMCVYFDPAATDQCREDDAERVREKETANFCDWFAPASGRFDSRQKVAADRAGEELSALFGESEAPEREDNPQLDDAEKLFH